MADQSSSGADGDDTALSNNPLHPQIHLLAHHHHTDAAGGGSSDDEDSEVMLAENAAAAAAARAAGTGSTSSTGSGSGDKKQQPALPPPPPPKQVTARPSTLPPPPPPLPSAQPSHARTTSSNSSMFAKIVTAPVEIPPRYRAATTAPIGQASFSAAAPAEAGADADLPPLPGTPPSPSGTPPPPPAGASSPVNAGTAASVPSPIASSTPATAATTTATALPPPALRQQTVPVVVGAGGSAFDAILAQLGGDITQLKAHFDQFVKKAEESAAASPANNHAGPIAPTQSTPPVPPRPTELASEYRKALRRGRVSLINASPLALLTQAAAGGANTTAAGGADSTPGATGPSGLVPSAAAARTQMAVGANVPGNPQLAALLVNKARMVHVHCIEGLNMPAMDKNGLSDPFAVLKIRTAVERDTGKEDKKADLSYTTKTITESLHPVWDEFCSLAFGNYSDELIVDVFDFDKYSSNDYIGRVVIPLITLVGQKPVPKWFNLVDKAEENIVQGCVLLRLVTDDAFVPKAEREKPAYHTKRLEMLQVRSPLPTTVAPPNPIVPAAFHDDSLQSGLSQNLNVFCTTWNIGNAPPPESLDLWLQPGYDMYVIAAQECKYTARGDLQTPSFDWLATLIRHFGKEHSLVKYHCLWDIRMAIFTTNAMRKRISNVHAATEATGIGNVLGNKGGVVVSLTFNHTDLCFVASHLAAHQDKTKARNKNVRDIIKNIKVGSHSDIANEYYHVFWMGDLNYRLEYGNQGIHKSPSTAQFDEMVKKIDAGKFGELFLYDQLQKERKADRVFTGFVEGNYAFKPTFKVARHLPEIRYEPSRSPAYCDRVLWKSALGFKVRQVLLTSVEAMRTSDHKPVVSTFEIDTWTLPPGRDPARGIVALSFPSIVLENFKPHGPIDPDPDKKADSEKPKPIPPVDLFVRFQSPCLSRPYTTAIDKKTVGHQWLGNMPAPLQYNAYERLVKTLFKVHLVNKKGDVIIGRGVISLAGMSDKKTTGVEFNTVLTYEGVSIGNLRGNLRMDWKGDYPIGTTAASPIAK